MINPFQPVQWPAIIKLHADDELIFISDANAFVRDEALRIMQMQPQDQLIDSAGMVYHIRNRPALELNAAYLTLSLDAVEELLQLHLSNQGTCCVSKFHASSIREAFINVFVRQAEYSPVKLDSTFSLDNTVE